MADQIDQQIVDAAKATMMLHLLPLQQVPDGDVAAVAAIVDDTARAIIRAVRDADGPWLPAARCPAGGADRCIMPADHGGDWHDDGAGCWPTTFAERFPERRARAMAEAVGARFSESRPVEARPRVQT